MTDVYKIYGDIIDLPNHRSEKRPHMSMSDRAAQFAPFAALRGYDEQIDSSTAGVLGADYRNDLFADEDNYIETGDVD
ncbi:MAG: hypothetical protein J5584_07555 [Clostridia bacterium]|jgi:hypothetical protein|nr:hypothetical protein [Clostridia bacterium]